MLAFAGLFILHGVAGSRNPGSGPLTSFADPFVGVDGGGNTVPGPQLPFGFVNLSPDTTPMETSGYTSSGRIVGFSHTHVTGTGGGSKYGNFLTTPVVGEVRLADLASGKADETASPGYYEVMLTRHGIKAELTTTRLVGMHRYTFPPSKQAQVLIDGCSIIRMRGPEIQVPVDCVVRVLPPNRIEGTGHFDGGWNLSPYTLHFSAEFNRPFSAFGTWVEEKMKRGAAVAQGKKVGAFVTFDTSADPVLLLRVGVSFIGAQKARDNIESEIPDWNFDRVRQEAETEWERVLGRIQVEGGTEAERKIFYTALYRAHCMPHDLTGENAWWASNEPHYEDYDTLWDTFRTLHPLLTLIQPERQRDMVRSLVDTYVHTGWLPDSRIAGANGRTQGGSNGDVLLADALVKDLKGIDYARAYEALVKDAEVDSPRPLFEGREVAEYKRLGYLSMNSTRSASRTVEYAYDDFCIAQVAERLGRQDDYQRYLKRSGNWANLWDKSNRCIRPRYADGRWLEHFSPTHDYPDRRFSFWEAPLYEGNGWQYATYVPHDVQGLINRLGGDEGFVTWLDEFFGRGVYNPGNEPDILAPYMYIHAGRLDRTAERVRHLLATQYKTGRAGLPGNDDAGTMSAWFVWGAIGLYPNAGQPYYYIGSPIFRRSQLELGGGRSFVVEAPETSSVNLYVQSAELNGKRLGRAWLRHAEVAGGGRLLLHMGPKPSAWGKQERPPSVSPPGNGTP